MKNYLSNTKKSSNDIQNNYFTEHVKKGSISYFSEKPELKKQIDLKKTNSEQPELRLK
jgi:hypothetical protein